MTTIYAKALIGLCIDEGLKQGFLKNRSEVEELLDYLDKYFAGTGKIASGSSEIPNDMNEAAKDYAFNNAEDGGEYNARYLGFIAGAEWQADHTPLPEDTVLFNNGVEEGKRLMMEEAEPAEIGYFNHRGLSILTEKSIERMPVSEGDKVRIIILKEDEK